MYKRDGYSWDIVAPAQTTQTLQGFRQGKRDDVIWRHAPIGGGGGGGGRGGGGEGGGGEGGGGIASTLIGIYLK